MEALYSCTIAPSRAAMDASPVARWQIPSLCFSRCRAGLDSVKVACRGLVYRRCRFRVQAVGKELDGDGSADGGANDDETFLGVGFLDDDKLSFSENTSNQIIGDKIAAVAVEYEKTDEGTQINVASAASTAQRAGLCRTPISGGVQSATSVNDLPRPALAVRNLMEQARYAQLCTLMSRMHHRREGYPFGSLVDFATDEMGHPIFQFSPLAIHTRNLLADSRCTLVVQIPGWSGLSNARVTVFGDITPLPNDLQEWACQRYIAKHQQRGSQQWGNFCFYRMQTISDIYFIGGFGTVAWVDVKEYEGLQPDKIAINGGEQNLKELNVTFSKKLKEILSTDIEVDDAALISVDSKGTDIRVRQGTKFNIQRLSFEVECGVETLEDAKAALQKIIDKSAKQRRHHQ